MIPLYNLETLFVSFDLKSYPQEFFWARKEMHSPLLLDNLRQGGNDTCSLGSCTELLTRLDDIQGVHELSVSELLDDVGVDNVPEARYILGVNDMSAIERRDRSLPAIAPAANVYWKGRANVGQPQPLPNRDIEPFSKNVRSGFLSSFPVVVDILLLYTP
jgi:hypothetical protein